MMAQKSLGRSFHRYGEHRTLEDPAAEAYVHESHRPERRRRWPLEIVGVVGFGVLVFGGLLLHRAVAVPELTPTEPLVMAPNPVDELPFPAFGITAPGSVESLPLLPPSESTWGSEAESERYHFIRRIIPGT